VKSGADKSTRRGSKLWTWHLFKCIAAVVGALIGVALQRGLALCRGYMSRAMLRINYFLYFIKN
jgi:H+/Cl- antiporter ClcA